MAPHILVSDHIFFIPVGQIVPSRQSWTHFFKISSENACIVTLSKNKDLRQLVLYDYKSILILLVGTTRIKHVFYCITVSNSVDFDQTSHIQKESDLCLHPFLRPFNPFGIFFDL